MLLAIARITGETAPLLFTALNNQFWSLDLNAPMASLPVVIFQFALCPYDDWQQLAWTGALLITFAVLALNIVARVALPVGKRHDGPQRSTQRPTPRISSAPAASGGSARRRSRVRDLRFLLRR